MFVFVDLSWRRGLCAKKLQGGTAIDKKKQAVGAKGARRGRVGAMRVVATVHTFGLCGT